MPTRPDLSCAELVDQVTDYLDDALDAEQHARFEDHLVQCPSCARYVEQLRATVSVLSRLPTKGLSEPARERLLEPSGSGAACSSSGVPPTVAA